MLEFSARPATLTEFQGLRVAAGMSVFPDAAVRISLERTLFGVWLRDAAGALKGMGRITGDGGCFVQINDVAVDPDHQRRGHGHAIMTRLMGWADSALPTGCYISLIADPGAERLYEAHGFAMRTGMARRVR